MTARPPVLLFDGDCRLCTRTATWAVRHACVPVTVLPWQKAAHLWQGLSEQELRRAAWWIDGSGRRSRGHRAVGRLLVSCGGAWSVLGRLLLLPPPFAWFASFGYRALVVVRHRLPGAPGPPVRESGPLGAPAAKRRD